MSKEKFLIEYGNEHHLDQLSHHGSSDIRAAVARKTKNQGHIERFLNDKFEVKLSLAENPYLTKDHIDKLVNDEHGGVRYNLARNPNLTKEHLDKLVNDSDWGVRYNLVNHPNITEENLDKLAEDDYSSVRNAAMKQLETRFK